MRLIENPIELIEHIYNGKSFSDYVFIENYDHYFFLPHSIVLCSAANENEDFALQIFDFCKKIGETRFYIASVSNNDSSYSFEFDTNVDNKERYLDAVNYEDGNNKLMLLSYHEGIGVWGGNKGWAIFAEMTSEIAVLSINEKYLSTALESFQSLLYKTISDLRNDMQPAYNASVFEEEFDKLVKNYKLGW